MANFLKNHLYGKPGQRDLTEADLPENRLQLFKQVLGVRKGDMIGLNLVYLVVWMPAILWSFLNLLQFSRIDDPSAVLFTWLLLLAPLVAITAPFNAGITYVMCRWARDDHSFVFSDFMSALKGNWKQSLLFGLLDGMVPLLFYLCVSFYMQLAGQSALFLLPLAVSCIAAALWCIAAPVVPGLIVSYRQGLGGILRNALLMTLGQLPRAAAIRLATLAVPVLAFLGISLFPGAFSWIVFIASMLYIVGLLAFNRLIWASFANFLGEKYLNPNIEGARTDIGLRPREEE